MKITNEIRENYQTDIKTQKRIKKKELLKIAVTFIVISPGMALFLAKLFADFNILNFLNKHDTMFTVYIIVGFLFLALFLPPFWKWNKPRCFQCSATMKIWIKNKDENSSEANIIFVCDECKIQADSFTVLGGSD